MTDRARATSDEATGQPGISLATMEQATSLSATAAVKTQLEAKRHRLVADRREVRGDIIGALADRSEAAQLERIADLALNPALHTTGHTTIGTGGEMAIGTSRYIDTVRERPDMLAIDASQRRMELADKADVLQLGLDAAASIRAANSMEKMLATQMSAAHVAAMEMQAEARELMKRYKRTGYIHQQLSVEAGRLMNASARMMDTYQHGLLTLQKIRSGGTQTVIVQHVNVGDGGRAMVAGQVKVRGKKGRRPGATDGGGAGK